MDLRDYESLKNWEYFIIVIMFYYHDILLSVIDQINTNIIQKIKILYCVLLSVNCHSLQAYYIFHVFLTITQKHSSTIILENMNLYNMYYIIEKLKPNITHNIV